jgi:hypothetical protein
MGMKEEIKLEGYWWSKHEKNLNFPKPIAQEEPWKGQLEFLSKLIKLENELNQNLYRGMSTCRVCHCWNGNGEFNHKGWRWPEGLRHYIEVHNVKPSSDFINMVGVK